MRIKLHRGPLENLIFTRSQSYDVVAIFIAI